MAFTVIIDPGHGGSDSGAVNGTRREADDNLRFSLALGSVLSNCGLRIIYTRRTDVFVPLEERSRISNNNNANLFVSIHRNSHSNTSAHGYENWVYQNPSDAAVAAAWLVHDRIIRAGVTADRGVRRGNFAVLRNTRAPAMLLELGFISNANDNRFFDNNFSRHVLAVAAGILNYFGIACPGVTAPGTPPSITAPPINPPPPPPSNNQRLNGTVRTTGGSLNVRQNPNTNAQIIALLQNNSPVQITGESNGFYHIIFNNQTGWASSQFINATPRNARVTTTGGNLNMRNAPSTNAAVIANLTNGTAITVRDIVGNFYQITANGQTGWASRDFITLV